MSKNNSYLTIIKGDLAKKLAPACVSSISIDQIKKVKYITLDDCNGQHLATIINFQHEANDDRR